ncbi:uncharacterized protein MYCFIDRAFT_76336 [Pseudocercospora fijiensis CIRAD86]|uniref:Uncharacterized protein n=1 Tax=Pseudocercospora fijiensis (strain CIRAD86) TaxID=383855 RepID=N1Q823_PSEFD|nr:uncharacterized protein MYCFIDRAFT_76336 [Pseudocercospora fijiensis CIRAD86]EME88954.1 hypothetical protein MYCFIDRAFT_76336 [Pseudocercospora fijiensis CIRAD86]
MSNSSSQALMAHQSEFEDGALPPLVTRGQSGPRHQADLTSKRHGRIFFDNTRSDDPAMGASDRLSAETAMRRCTVGGSMNIAGGLFDAESNAASPNASTRALLEESRRDDASSIYSVAPAIDLQESMFDYPIRAHRDRHALPPSIVEKNAIRMGSPQDTYQRMEMSPRRAADEVLCTFQSAPNAPDVDIQAGTVTELSPDEKSGSVEATTPSALFGKFFQLSLRSKQQKPQSDAALGSVDQSGSDSNPGYFERQRQKRKSLQSHFRRRSTIRWQDPPPSASPDRRQTVTCREVRSDASESNPGVDDGGRSDEWREQARVERITRASVSAVANTGRKASRSLSKTWGNIEDFGKKTQRGFQKLFRQDSAMALESASAGYPFASGALPADASLEDIGDGSAVNYEDRLANFPYRSAILLPNFKLSSPLAGIASPHYSLSSDLAPGDAARHDDDEEAAILEGMEGLERMIDPSLRNVPVVEPRERERTKSPIAIEIDSAMRNVRRANLAVTPPKANIRKMAADNREKNLADAVNAVNRAVKAGDFETANIQKYFDRVPSCTDKAKQRVASMSFREQVASEQEMLHKAYLESMSGRGSADDIPLMPNQDQRRLRGEGDEEVERGAGREGASQSKTSVAAELAALAGIVGNIFQGAGGPIML